MMRKVISYAVLMLLLIVGVAYIGRPEVTDEEAPEVHTVGETEVQAEFTSNEVEYNSVAEAKKDLDFEVWLPSLSKEGYMQTKVSIIDETILQVIYTGAENIIVYRTGEGMGNISGDYELYEMERELDIYGTRVTLKGLGMDTILLAYFEMDGIRYSLAFKTGIPEETLVHMVLRIKDDEKTG